jgi:hypothetical protein
VLCARLAGLPERLAPGGPAGAARRAGTDAATEEAGGVGSPGGAGDADGVKGRGPGGVAGRGPGGAAVAATVEAWLQCGLASHVTATP